MRQSGPNRTELLFQRAGLSPNVMLESGFRGGEAAGGCGRLRERSMDACLLLRNRGEGERGAGSAHSHRHAIIWRLSTAANK